MWKSDVLPSCQAAVVPIPCRYAASGPELLPVRICLLRSVPSTAFGTSRNSGSGIGLGALVYSYNGDVYASDEGRMLAEMGDRTFRLGNVHDSSYADVMLSDSLLGPLTESITLSAPMCSTCAFEPYCGADPVFHHATAGDFAGHKALSAFCRRNMGVFTLLLRKMRDDPYFRDLMRRWSQ